ncbi:MAG: MFS transporter [Pseudolysinimonas sp.]
MSTATPARAGRREWLGLAVLALPTILISIDIGVLYLALPSLSRELHADGTQQLWILDIYSFLLAGFLVTMGNLGDRIGRRRLLLIGAALFGAASLLAAFSTTPEMLIVARALLGVAGATLSPSTMALIRNMFTDPKQMGTAFGVWFACFMGGMLVGPLIGGLLLEHFWWGSVFLLGIPVMVLLLIVGPFLLPEYKAAEPGRIDLASVGMSLTAILPAIWGIKELARGGVAAVAVIAIVAGLAMGVLFVRRQLQLSDPLLDLQLFRSRVFSTSLVMMMLGGVIMAAISLVSATFLQLVIGLSPLQAGLWLIPQNVVMIIGFQVAPLLARRLPVPTVIALGLGIGAIGFGLQAFVTPQTAVGIVALGLSLASFGMAFPMALLTTLLMAATAPDKAGAAAAVNETAGEFGIAVGIATLGTLATLVFRLQLGGAFDSLPSALTTADDLGGSAGDALASAARAAYSTGYNVVAALGVVIFIGMAIVALTVLRRREDAPELMTSVASASQGGSSAS